MKKTQSKKTIVNHKRKLDGIVVSSIMAGTVVVKVTTKKAHPLYKKVVKTWKKYKADTKGKTYQEGDSVVIEESRSLSKEKNWVVIS